MSEDTETLALLKAIAATLEQIRLLQWSVARRAEAEKSWTAQEAKVLEKLFATPPEVPK